ncbi:MAG: peptidoglycan DD-metalloendopeptidase family protein [Actinobacteria bacterium]|nr:peptidoglycan DD-metalloendopeptidase family protein [Actinomycetota bacterium]
MTAARRVQAFAAAAVASLVVALAPSVASAHGTGHDQRALDDARRKVSAVEAQLRSARAEQRDADQALRDADARLSLLEEAVNEAAAALDRQQLAVDEAAGRVAQLQDQMAAQRDAFASRAATLYKRGAGLPFEAVLSAGSLGEALDRGAYVQALSSSDRAALEGLVATRTATDAERVRLAAERDHLAAMKVEQERLLAQVAELRRDRALQAAAARANVAGLEEQREDLEAESRRVEQLIRRKEAAARAARSAASASSTRSARGAVPAAVGVGGYAWPRCDRVTSGFGRRWGRMHTGIDIDGNTGDPIFAAKAGQVLFVGWQGGYGRLTLIAHGDGVVTAYAHQSAFAVADGQRVAQGQRIGSVGSTGYSTGSHLHFETRVSGTPVDPRRYLPGRC